MAVYMYRPYTQMAQFNCVKGERSPKMQKGKSKQHNVAVGLTAQAVRAFWPVCNEGRDMPANIQQEAQLLLGWPTILPAVVKLTLTLTLTGYNMVKTGTSPFKGAHYEAK